MGKIFMADSIDWDYSDLGEIDFSTSGPRTNPVKVTAKECFFENSPEIPASFYCFPRPVKNRKYVMGVESYLREWGFPTLGFLWGKRKETTYVLFPSTGVIFLSQCGRNDSWRKDTRIITEVRRMALALDLLGVATVGESGLGVKGGVVYSLCHFNYTLKEQSTMTKSLATRWFGEKCTMKSVIYSIFPSGNVKDVSLAMASDRSLPPWMSREFGSKALRAMAL